MNWNILSRRRNAFVCWSDDSSTIDQFINSIGGPAHNPGHRKNGCVNLFGKSSLNGAITQFQAKLKIKTIEFEKLPLILMPLIYILYSIAIEFSVYH
jgi:hypothetical protein